MMTCLCKDDTPRSTLTRNPMTGVELYLCNLHARLHREGHTFSVIAYKEGK